MEDEGFTVALYLLLLLLIVIMLKGCTLNWRGAEQDYDIAATVRSTRNGCEIEIRRTEVRAEKKADVAKQGTTQ